MTFGAVPLSAILIMCACALLAVAIFAPRKPIVPRVSFAPSVTSAAVDHAAVTEPLPAAPSSFADVPHAEPADDNEPWRWDAPAAPATETTWPELVDAKAAGIDAPGRIALVTALAALHAPWADAILERAYRDEPDAEVLEAILAHRAVA